MYQKSLFLELFVGSIRTRNSQTIMIEMILEVGILILIFILLRDDGEGYK